MGKDIQVRELMRLQFQSLKNVYKSHLDILVYYLGLNKKKKINNKNNHKHKKITKKLVNKKFILVAMHK